MMHSRATEWQGLDALEDRQLLAFVTWDGGGGDQLWSNPLNWSGDALPGAADHVLIDAPGQQTIRHDTNVTTAVASLWSMDPLELSAGTLAVAGQWRQSAALTVSGGRIEGGNLQLNGALAWSGGTIAGGAAKLQVLAGSSVTISGDVMLSRELINNGTLTWVAGTITIEGGRILNLRDRTFLIQSEGTLAAAGTGGWLINYGSLVRDGTAGSTTTIAVGFKNYAGAIGVPPPGVEAPRGIVDVRSGTLAFTGAVPQKQGTTLVGGDWRVSSSSARLLLPGPDIDYVFGGARIVLNGAGAAFPQLENAVFMYDLTLSGGREFTFTRIPSASPGFFLIGGISTLTINSPGVTTTIAARISVGRLVVQGGTVNAAAGLSGIGFGGASTGIDVGAGAALNLGGETELRNSTISGAGLIRIVGLVDWYSGAIEGPGSLLIAPGGRLALEPDSAFYYYTGYKVLTRRVVNYGTIDWTSSGLSFLNNGTVELTGEIVNRGEFIIRSSGFAIPLPGVHTPGIVSNYGTITVYAPQEGTKLRGAGGGVLLVNRGFVRVAQGQFIMNGGTAGGGAWLVEAGAELVFGGLDGWLSSATIEGAGRVRVANTSAWTDVTVGGGGDMVVTVPGELTLNGQDTVINRSAVTNNGWIGLGLRAGATVGYDLINNGELVLNSGELRVSGALTLSSSSRVTLGGSLLAVPGQGGLSVGGTAALGGSLVSSFVTVGLTALDWEFLRAGGLTGAFDSMLGPRTAIGWEVLFEFTATTGRLRVVPA